MMSKDQPNSKDIQGESPPPNIFLHPEIADIILTFLNRVAIKGNEARALLTAQAAIQQVIKK